MLALIVFEVPLAYFLCADHKPTNPQTHKPTNPQTRLVAKNGKLGEQNEVSLATLSQLSMILLDLYLTKVHYMQLIGDCRYNVQISQRTEFAEMVRSSVSNGFGFFILDATPSKHIEGHSRHCPKLIRDPLPAYKFGVLIQNGIK